MEVKLRVVGCSPAWPNPGGAQSGYLVEGREGGRVLLDCGPGVLARLREWEAWPRVDAIAITHWHLDHWGDLVPWVWGAMFGPARELPAPEVWLPPEGKALLADLGARLGKPEMFEEAFELREYEPGAAFETAGMEVTPVRVLHYQLEAYGFRVAANGSVLAYSGDSGPDEGLVELARDADLFVCEATLDDGNEANEGSPRGHLSPSEAQAAFEASGAKRLVLTHRPAERSLDAAYEQVRDGQELHV
jgi:ribonuclease BN (tRNA processing enzyme)